jgi:K+-sensing histidine kinase KdpD
MSWIAKLGIFRPETFTSRVCNRWLGPLSIATVLVGVTTALLLGIYLTTHSAHLIYGYLVPITFIAVRYGSVPATVTAVASDICAAYYLYPPDFSIYITDPLQVAELTFFSLLVLPTCQFIGGLADDERLRLRRRAPISK